MIDHGESPAGRHPDGPPSGRVPRLQDGNFDRAVVFVLDHGPEGALGIIINRPMLTPVAEILSPWAAQAELAAPAVMFTGGPVAPSAVIGLGRASDDAAGRGWTARPARCGSHVPAEAGRGAPEEEVGHGEWRLLIGGVERHRPVDAARRAAGAAARRAPLFGLRRVGARSAGGRARGERLDRPHCPGGRRHDRLARGVVARRAAPAGR